MNQPERLLARTVTAIAAMVSVMVAVTIPLVYFLTAYDAERNRLQAYADFVAGAVSRQAYLNPLWWRFASHRLPTTLAEAKPAPAVQLRVFDRRDQPVAEHRDELAPSEGPVVSAWASVDDGTEVVGRVEAVMHLGTVLSRTGAAAAFGIGLATLIFFPIRTLPLRALIRATGEVVQARDDLAVAVAELEYEVLQRRQVERDMRESEARFQRAVEGSNDGLWDWDLMTQEGYFSPRMREMLGYRDDAETLAIGVFEALIEREDQDRYQAAKRAHLASDAPFDVEMRLAVARTASRWFRIRGRAIRDLGGRPTRMAGSLQDITRVKEAEEEIRALNRDLDRRVRLRTEELDREIAGHRRTEQELRASEARYRAVVEDQLDLVCRFDRDLRLSFVNEAFCRYFGRPRDEVLGHTLRSFLPTGEWDRLRTMLSRVNETRPFDVIEYRAIAADGALSWQEWHVRAIGEAGGQVAELQAVGRDVTDRRLAEEQVMKLTQELEHRVDERTRDLIREIEERRVLEVEHLRLEQQLLQAQKMEALGQLAGGLAHDFNNMLSPIMLTVQHVMDTPGMDVTTRKNLGNALLAAEHARDLVQQVLAFARPNRGGRRRVRLGGVVDDALDLLEVTVPAGVTVVRSIEESALSVVANPAQLHQLVMNLGTNAIQAMEQAGGTLTVAVREIAITRPTVIGGVELALAPHARITFSDTGCGVDDSTLIRIFEPFFSTKSSHRNTGLGLSVVHRVVTDHGGAIGVESRVGEGTTFSVYIPLDVTQ